MPCDKLNTRLSRDGRTVPQSQEQEAPGGPCAVIDREEPYMPFFVERSSLMRVLLQWVGVGLDIMVVISIPALRVAWISYNPVVIDTIRSLHDARVPHGLDIMV